MTQATSTELRAAIVAANARLMAAFRRGSAADVAAAYSDDGKVLPPNSDAVDGKQAIQSFWQGAMNMGIAALQLETAEVEGFSSSAHEVGTPFRVQGDR